MKKILVLLYAAFLFLMLSSCRTNGPISEEQTPLVSVKAKPLIQGDIESEISFNGTTVYLKKNQVVSPIAGYIFSASVKFGEEVKKNEVLFEIQTRESKALESDKAISGNFGTVKALATSDGFINELNINEPGVYVAEGSILCNIIDIKDLIVKVNVPFEYNSILINGRKCKIRLSDNTSIGGSVFRVLPVVDEINQTQTVLIKPETKRQLPDNLNLTVTFINEKHTRSFLVAKSSLMTNETQSEFWIMKIEGNKLAVKIPVKKGIVNDSIAEIFSPKLSVNDLIITEGAYGLPDSSIIRIER